jgi:8-amino-3,8-dideoxy-alpha-D-manno-octulosonate transaminase
MWVATVGVVVLTGAIPVLCEVDASFTMDPRDLARKITRRTRLIIPIHMTGAPCRIDAIMRVANRHKIPVLEDCAQCNGGRYKGRKVGTFGAMGIFSLQLNKNMTCGEGGLIITNDLKLYNRAFGAHDMGMIRVKGRLALPERDEITWGGGRRMTELCAAIASVQLGKLDTITGHMRESKLRIKKILQTVPGLKFRTIHDPKGDTGAFLTLILKDRAAVEKALPIMRENGLTNASFAANYGLHIYYNIPALVNKVPLSRAGDPWKLHENRASKYDYHKGVCPASDALFERSIIMPIPSRLTRAQEKQAASIISRAVRSV